MPHSEEMNVGEPWNTLRNLLPGCPNSIAVAMKDGKEYYVVVSNRRNWLDALVRFVRELTSGARM